MFCTKTSERHHKKVLKTILSQRKPYNNKIVADKSFYALCGLPLRTVEESLNALAALDVIEIFPPEMGSYPIIEIKQKAYAYLPEKKVDAFRFWFPTIISIVAIIISMLSYLKQ